MDDEHLQKTLHMSAGLNGDEDPYGMEDCKPVTFFSFNTQFFFEHFVTYFHLIGFCSSSIEETNKDETAAREPSKLQGKCVRLLGNERWKK